MISLRNVILLLMTFFSLWALAQEKEIVGTVRNKSGEPLASVSVILKGSTTGTSTNEEGKFQLNLKQGSSGILVFSHGGYQSREERLAGQSTVEIIMTESLEDLEEVVVVGYGTAKRKDLTGAVSSVQADKLEKEAPRSVQDLLRGNAAGMIIGQGSTAKGDAPMLVRGKGTLKAGSSPLTVVDGVIFDGSFEDLNPNDIQSIDILKDASATAVFGAKAANGVILITTKKGKTGKPMISFNANVGVVQNAKMPRVMTGEEFLAYRYDYEIGRRTDEYLSDHPEMFVDPRKLTGVNQLDWYNYDQKDPVSSVSEKELLRSWLSRLELKSPEIDNYMANNLTNWQDLVFHNGFQQDYSASVSNSSEHSSYYLSFNHIDREGVVVGDRFKNFRTRLNLEAKIAPFLKVGANNNFAARNEGFLAAEWGQSAIISPYGSNNIGDSNSPYQRLPTGDVTPLNPFYDNMFRDRVDRYNTLTSNLYAIVKLPFGIEFQSTFSPYLSYREYYNHDSSNNPEWKAKGGSSERRNEKTYNWQIDNILRWKKSFNEHSLEVTLLQNAEKGQFWMTSAKASKYTPSDVLGWHRIQAGSVPLNESDDTYKTGDAMMARVYYSYRSKYMVTASVRRDGYSAFGAQNPRATFPALAFAWNFSDENFMKFASSWLDYGKLRLSWGKNGNRDIGQYDALSDMTSGLHPYIDQKGNLYLYSQLYVNRMENLGLKWETKASYNLGLDFSLFSNRLSGAFEYYNATTKDLLVDRALPNIIGFNSVAANLGELGNHGFEFTLNGSILRKDNFNWNATAIFMVNRRKIKKLYGDMIPVRDASGNIVGEREADDIKNKWFIGQDPDRIWDYERVGVWQVGEEAEAKKYGLQPGDFKYKDQNEDGVMTNADRVFQGYTTPRFRWSLRNDFNYKNFDLSLFLYSNWGQNHSFNRAANNSVFADRATDYYMGRWTAANPINDYARIGSKNIGNNYVDKSFVRLESITFSYRVPAEWLKKVHVQNMRISAAVRNAAVWAPHWKFRDPEAETHTDSNDDKGKGPTPRTFSLGVNFAL
ncbi:SusC/RagA family TonB-linked outer membrane protein [Sphingobacterium sp. UT-1RO-CII-1]|uniref:SusC/RagA family TonB-linked outer membrane protein n=1 Tax=Sphingobacterium sp. UT-1RO-CII-1 TaxID=2995225 RepID=UPI00227C9FC0|nr:SusC/RagA family TonB-linked outer membrane protein [Sphingobacterium sp. UT-1RO-CII-1]MCY4778072.1 SusC/RagA family TonB-linked outer membrane protein [Sphingobacterium sp. UT-1RO-CII-1]